MMSKNELKENLLELLSEELAKKDFKLNRTLSEFTRKNKDGWHKFQVIFLKKEDGWEIKLGLLIRKNVVEDIFHKVSYYEPQYHKSTPTIGISITEYLNDGNDYRFSLVNKEDLAYCVKEIERLFTEVALPFFDKFDTLSAIDIALNGKSDKSIFGGYKYEGNMGIIVAKLVNNPEYLELKEKYLEFYKNNYDGFYLKEFQDLIEVLE